MFSTTMPTGSGANMPRWLSLAIGHHDDGEKMILTPTYYVFEMYKVHQQAALIW
jgi:alpha-L-arabinofuranosidase